MDFFTSDWHLNDELILKVCKRNFKSAKRMTEVLIKQANMRAKDKTDTIIHVGDFIQRGLDRGTGVREDQISARDALNQLAANVILLEGNHDDNNRCNTAGKILFRKVGKFDCIVQHFPSINQEAYVLPVVGHSSYVYVNVCGHVHDKWAFKYDEENSVLNVNVGIDIYPYMIKECDLAMKIEVELKRLGKKTYKFL